MPAIPSILVDDEDRLLAGALQLRPQAVIFGTDGPDVLIGTAAADVIWGLGGDDQIFGRGGDDELRGGPGNDVIWGEAGHDLIFGGAGDDELRGGRGNDQIFGGAGNDLIFGGAGADELRGGLGSDEIWGGAGNDLIFGGAGPDELRGGPGSDEIWGGAGNDLIFGGAGADELRGGLGNDEIWGGNGNDQIFGGAGHDELRGGLGNDVIFGGKGNDLIFGGAGQDELWGGPGNDQIFGGTGNDVIFGEAGDDLIDGGQGRNLLSGGDGADTFRFSIIPGNPDNTDEIQDFDPAEDRFDLSPVLPSFESGNNLQLFVDFDTSPPEGTLLSVDPTGTGNFAPLAVLLGVDIASLPATQLGLPAPPESDLVIASASADGTPGNGASFAPSLSQDGRFVSFASSATNLIPGDDPTFDIFVKDLQTEAITRVSQTTEGVGGDADSFFSSITADGSLVAFNSNADNFPGDVNLSLDQSDIFVADRGDGSIQFVSIENNQFATFPSISADGTRIAFQATATGRAGTGDPADVETITQRIFVRDLTDDSLQEVSTDADGEFADDRSVWAEISADGRFVAFDSEATNLSPDDTNPARDIFRKDLDDGTIVLVSADAGGSQDGGRGSSAPTISADGRFVAFQTEARLDAELDFDGISDIYLKDLQTGAIVLVSTSSDGVKGDGESFSPSISDDGTLVAFRSAATNLVPGDDNGVHDIFVKNITTGEILRFEVTGDTSGAALPQAIMTLRPALSGDGSTVAFSDQVTIGEEGEIAAGQVVVAPVEFGLAPAGIASLESLLSPADVPV